MGALASVAAQVEFEKFPSDNQFFARNRLTGKGTVEIKGSVNKPDAWFEALRVDITRGIEPDSTFYYRLSYEDGTAGFRIRCGIKAELEQYKIEVRGVRSGVETLLGAASGLVAGDAFIIQGQSNAEAGQFSGDADFNKSPFIRVFGSGDDGGTSAEWYLAQGNGNRETKGNAGQWGLRLARLIVDSQRVPVAVFNGAHPARPLAFFLRHDVAPLHPSTNYGRLLWRLRRSGLSDHVRAVFWHQGESDAGHTSIGAYKRRFLKLLESWRGDFPNLEKVYIFQIANGCGISRKDVLEIKEAQRQLAAELQDVEIMSTSAQSHFSDDCHFSYKNGYEKFAENVYRLAARDLYGRPAGNIEPPNLLAAEATGPGEITLFMRQLRDYLTRHAGVEAGFILHGSRAKVLSATVEGHKIKLALSQEAARVTAISYGGRPYTASPMVTNANGVGAVHFYRQPITKPAYRDSVVLSLLAREAGIEESEIRRGIAPPLHREGRQRVVGLSLSGQLPAALPPAIGHLDALLHLDLSGNRLTAVPEEITLLTLDSGLDVSDNRLCALPEDVQSWIDTYSLDKNWRQTQFMGASSRCVGSVDVGY